jgi:hypothetical protein
MAAREVNSRDDMRHGGDTAGAAGTARLLRRRRGWLWTGLAALAGFTVYGIISASYLGGYAPAAPRAACAAAVPVLLAAALFGLAAAAADTARLRRADPGTRASALAAADLFPLTAHPYYRRPAHRASWCCGLLVLGTLSIPAVLDMPRELAAAAYLAGIGGQDSGVPAGGQGCAPVSCPDRGESGWADPLPLGRSLPTRALIAATGPDPGLFPGFGTEIAVLQLGLVFDGFAALAVLAVLPQARHLVRARIRPPRPHLPRRRRAAAGQHRGPAG